MSALENVDRRQAAAVDVEAFARIVLEAPRTAIGNVHVDNEPVIELEVRLPLQKPVEHHLRGFHADVTGC